MEKTVSGTKEWATHTKNILSGCGNDCLYCYAKEMAIRYKRKTPNTWVEEELNEKAYNAKVGKKEGTIMYPSTHDIRPENIHYHLEYLRKLILAGNQVLIVSKPFPECIELICDMFNAYKDQILFRFTIGSTNNNILNFWEPNAPTVRQRVKSLAHAFEKGFKTSISAEPMLDEEPEIIADVAKGFVTDAIWFGKMNNGKQRLTANGHNSQAVMEIYNRLSLWQSDPQNILRLYNRFKDDPKIKWKESIKKVVGIEVPTTKGLDI